MSMENETAPKAAPRKKRQVAKKVKAAPSPAAPKALAGLTKAECCNACNVDSCEISGKPYCAHPAKGGLHASDMIDHVALKRFQAAQRSLSLQKLT